MRQSSYSIFYCAVMGVIVIPVLLTNLYLFIVYLYIAHPCLCTHIDIGWCNARARAHTHTHTHTHHTQPLMQEHGALQHVQAGCKNANAIVGETDPERWAQPADVSFSCKRTRRSGQDTLSHISKHKASLF